MAKFFGNNKDNNNTEVEQTTLLNKETSNNNLILIKGKVAQKGLKSFLRCGIKFSDQFQELEVDEATLRRLKAEPKLTIQEIK